MIAEASATIDWLAYDGAAEDENHPMLKLLARPNPSTSGPDMLEQIFTNLLLSGNAYVEAGAGETGPVRELHSLRPDRMRVIPGSDGVAGYLYSVGGRFRCRVCHCLDRTESDIGTFD